MGNTLVARDGTVTWQKARCIPRTECSVVDGF